MKEGLVLVVSINIRAFIVYLVRWSSFNILDTCVYSFKKK